MIAVLANPAESGVVREFFELFKTPWEFYRSGSQCDVLICSSANFRESLAKLVLIYDDEPGLFDREKGIEIRSQLSSSIISFQGRRIPIYGNCLTFGGAAVDFVADENTQESAVLEIPSQQQTFVRVGYDLFQEIRHLLTRGQPTTHAGIPALELHIAILRDLIIRSSIPLIEIPPVPSAYNFVVCLTHDVDHFGIRNHKCDRTMFGFLYRALVGSLINFCRGRRSFRQVAINWMAAFSLPFVYLGIAKDFWADLDRYVEIEKGLGSTFFLMPQKGDPGVNGEARRATRYEIAAIVPQVRRLLSERREIGLHGIDAWRDSSKGHTELDRIRRVTDASEMGVRMHWLFFDEKSPAILEEAGFSYDSTIGYNETVGYRAGTTQAFKPLGVERILELPMHIMDTALFYPDYLSLSPNQARTVIAPLIENAVRFGGVLTVNWHDRSIAPERLWDDFYISLLEELRSHGPWFPTAAQAVSWFRKRRSAVFEDASRDGEAIRVKVALNQDDESLPGLRLRVHNAPVLQTRESRSAMPDSAFTDTPFNRSGEIQVAI